MSDGGKEGAVSGGPSESCPRKRGGLRRDGLLEHAWPPLPHPNGVSSYVHGS